MLASQATRRGFLGLVAVEVPGCRTARRWPFTIVVEGRRRSRRWDDQFGAGLAGRRAQVAASCMPAPSPTLAKAVQGSKSGRTAARPAQVRRIGLVSAELFEGVGEALLGRGGAVGRVGRLAERFVEFAEQVGRRSRAPARWVEAELRPSDWTWTCQLWFVGDRCGRRRRQRGELGDRAWSPSSDLVRMSLGVGFFSVGAAGRCSRRLGRDEFQEVAGDGRCPTPGAHLAIRSPAGFGGDGARSASSSAIVGHAVVQLRRRPVTARSGHRAGWWGR